MQTRPPIPEFITAICVMWLTSVQSAYSTVLPLGLHSHKDESKIYHSPGDKAFILNACALGLPSVFTMRNLKIFSFVERC
jgi:hypothetical protein